MPAYRLKHIPTGLYFRPSTEVIVKLPNGSWGYVKTNLSKTGKIYAKQPTIKWVGSVYYNHVYNRERMVAYGASSVWKHRNEVFATIPSEWEVEEVKL